MTPTPSEQAIRQRLQDVKDKTPEAALWVWEKEIEYLLALLDQLRAEGNDVRVVGDVPVSNTPRTSMDRRGVVAARGADPDPSPDQLLRDELIRDRDTWSQACASAIRELREEREQLRSLIQTWRQEGLTARRPMDHDAINACADDLEALLPPDAPQATKP